MTFPKEIQHNVSFARLSPQTKINFLRYIILRFFYLLKLFIKYIFSFLICKILFILTYIQTTVLFQYFILARLSLVQFFLTELQRDCVIAIMFFYSVTIVNDLAAIRFFRNFNE